MTERLTDPATAAEVEEALRERVQELEEMLRDAIRETSNAPTYGTGSKWSVIGTTKIAKWRAALKEEAVALPFPSACGPLTEEEMRRREVRLITAPHGPWVGYISEAHAEIRRLRSKVEDLDFRNTAYAADDLTLMTERAQKAEAERDRAEEALQASIAAMDELGDIRDERDKLRTQVAELESEDAPTSWYDQRLRGLEALLADSRAEAKSLRGLLERCRTWLRVDRWTVGRCELTAYEILRDLNAALDGEKEDPRG